MQDFPQIQWDSAVDADCRAIIRLAAQEDLAGQQDWTTVALVPENREGSAGIVTREAGVVAGMPTIAAVIKEMSARLTVDSQVVDGQKIEAGSTLAVLQGNVRDLLTVERTVLNLLSRLMGISTLANQYVSKIAGTKAKVYDTRKTTPGWRRLEKYAARCGGASNHRMGLYDSVLIKDNHLAQRGQQASDTATAVYDARKFLSDYDGQYDLQHLVVAVEVDTIEQLKAVLSAKPDIVLLDNMSVSELSEAVLMRKKHAPEVLLEASGGVTLDSLSEIAATGVERISVGALTHSVRSLDIGLDWRVS